ncbi:unnamed protein product [Caenorhabditis angaria]|uniref:DUF281 domain-containing protein n=1 Tax=Caenorhabditis angaria TaxID=860376 RepID=A0A9P1I832_9PELO|nr:unnamed protein product [Caenorhabditis angaria]
MRFDILVLLGFAKFFVAAQDEIEIASIAQCSSNKVACGATIYSYPLLEASEPDDLSADFSGYGSGVVPVYDEILTREVYDLNGTPTQHNFTICSCPENQACDFDSEENTVKVDYHVTLRFCNLSTIYNGCSRKSPSQVRVIGNAQESGDSVVSVSNAMMFCNCPTGFKRDKVENWIGTEVSLNYKCL